MTDIDLTQDARVGVVGSNSSTGSLTADLVGDSRNRSLNGRLVLVSPKNYDGTTEYGVGTVTEITTTNTYHEDPALRGVIAQQGFIGNLTGRGDIKTAKIDMQSAFRHDGENLSAIGGSLSFAPSTGEPIFLANADSVRSLCERTTKDLFYIGSVYQQKDIPLPLSFHDFSDARGAEMSGFFGPSGSGKTYNATMFTAAQMRHLRQAFLLIEPQSQFTTNSKVKRELPLDLRALADAQGREVKQISVAQQIRLPEDPSLLCDLLAGASFFGANRLIGANNQASNAHDVVEAFLEATPKWSSMTSEDILNRILQHLIERVENDAVVVSKAPKERLQRNLQAALDQDEDGGRERYKALMRVFGPLHNIFSETTAQGTPRLKMNEIVKALCDPDIGSAGNRRARPFYILTLADQSADNEGRETEVSKAMRNSKTQMVILRTLFSALEAEARWLYQSEDLGTANLMVIMDEAARFTSDSHKDVEQRAMAADMARYFRELRKYAVGFTLILQEPSALHDSIWKQLQNGFRAFAGGMVGNDLDKVREQVGAGGAMSLYQQLARPSKDNPIYPWMLCGSISPLSVTSTPIFMEAFTKPEQWEQANKTWLPGMFNISDIWQG